MKKKIEFLDLEIVLMIHDKQIKKYGGSEGIRDQGLLESAIAQPEQTFGKQYLYESIYDKASVYAYHIAENQPFEDGNKRTAVNAALLFLALNGKKITKRSMLLYDAMIAIAKKEMTREELSTLLRDLYVSSITEQPSDS